MEHDLSAADEATASRALEVLESVVREHGSEADQRRLRVIARWRLLRLALLWHRLHVAEGGDPIDWETFFKYLLKFLTLLLGILAIL